MNFVPLLKIYLILFCLLGISIPTFCQPEFIIDTVILPGHYIQKVNASRSSDIWVIEDTSARNIFRLDENLNLYNHSSSFQALTKKRFSSILNNEVNNTFVVAKEGSIYHWKNGIISKKNGLNFFNNKEDSTINAIGGYPLAPCGSPRNKEVWATSSPSIFQYNFYDTLNFYQVGGINFYHDYELLEVGKTYWSDKALFPIYYYSLFKYTDFGREYVVGSIAPDPPLNGYPFPGQHINTATSFNNTLNSMMPNLLVGTDDAINVVYNSKPDSVYKFLRGTKINKITKYIYNIPYALAGSDTGIYIIGYLPDPITIDKATFPENHFKTNDIDLSPDGCVWVASDNGLIKLKDINCKNYKSDFCISDSVLLLNSDCSIRFTSSICAKKWLWSFGDGDSAYTSNPTHIYDHSGTYTIHLISDNGVCHDTMEKKISILVCCDSSNYNFVNLGKDRTVCRFSKLDAGNCINCKYLWSTGDTTQSIKIDTSGTYWVTLKNKNGCSSTDTVHITISNVSVSFSGLLPECCKNSPPLNLIGSPTGGTFSGSGINGTAFNPNMANAGTDTIVYTYIDKNGCSTSDSKTINVHPIPIVNLTGLNTTYCINSPSVHLTGEPIGGIFKVNGVTQTFFNPKDIGAGSYEITYMYTDANGCSAADTHQVKINALPDVNFSPLDTAYCINHSSVNLIGSPSGGIFTGDGITGSTFTPFIIGLNTINYLYKDSNGCSNSSSKITQVVPFPVANISGLDTICDGESTLLIANNIGSPVWSTGESTAQINVSPDVSTNYFVTARNFCGSKTDSFLVTVKPIPVSTISHDTSIFIGNSVQLNVSKGILYSWTPSNSLSCSTCPNPLAIPLVSTTYLVTITFDNGCSTTKMVTVNVNDDSDLFVPDIFSPNADGQNDVLFVRGSGIKELNFIIFDRWGEKIFETDDINTGWDGSYKGKPLNNAVFVYYLSATFINDKKINKKGDITLLR